MLIPKPAGKRPNIAERAQQQQELHFRGWPQLWLWNLKVHHGYANIARTLPLAMQAIDAQSKGNPLGTLISVCGPVRRIPR